MTEPNPYMRALAAAHTETTEMSVLPVAEQLSHVPLARVMAELRKLNVDGLKISAVDTGLAEVSSNAVGLSARVFDLTRETDNDNALRAREVYESFGGDMMHAGEDISAANEKIGALQNALSIALEAGDAALQLVQAAAEKVRHADGERGIAAYHLGAYLREIGVQPGNASE